MKFSYLATIAAVLSLAPAEAVSVNSSKLLDEGAEMEALAEMEPEGLGLLAETEGEAEEGRRRHFHVGLYHKALCL